MTLYLQRDFFDDFKPVRPSRLLGQHFKLGLSPEDLLSPWSRSFLQGRSFQPWRIDSKDTGSTVSYDKEKFQVNLDLQQFNPEEINVKVVDNSVVVEGNHEEKQDEHEFLSRKFIRRYVLPTQYDLKSVQSSLSSDGMLTISAPKTDVSMGQERIIPITQTGLHSTTQDKETKQIKQDDEK